MDVADGAPAKTDSANMVHDAEWALTVECSFDSFAHDACMTVADMDVWYFDSAASKPLPHIVICSLLLRQF